ncbi:MAG: MCE family protein [Acidobacteriales bacterium]|nr:MCE family protein [Terriglobales bacterium]
MPSQQQLKWSQLRVGITVIVASITLAVLIFLMSGSGGIFTRKLTIKSYFQGVQGLRVGAPVALEGVTIGNVTAIRVMPGRQLDPVEVTMRVNPAYRFRIRKDSLANLSTTGVIGDVYVNIESKLAKLGEVQEGDEIPGEGATSIDDTVKAGQSTLQNMDVLVKRMDRILQTVESGQGTVGLLIKDPGLYNRANSMVLQMQQIVADINAGKGNIGKLLKDDQLYKRMDNTITKLEKIADDLDAGKGSAGKFLKDEALYKNANETLAKANQLMADINAGKGSLGKLAHDEEFARKFDTIVTKLASITERIDSGQGSVGKLMIDPSLYNNADQMLVETRNLVKAIRENPKKYLTIRFKLF